MVQEIQAILSFTIFVRNLKIQKWSPFLEREIFLRIEQSILHIYPVGQKYHRNRSILHGSGDTSNFKFYHFCQKFKMAATFGKRKNFFKLSRVSWIYTLLAKNFAEITLSRMV